MDNIISQESRKIEISHYWVFITEYRKDNPNIVDKVIRYKRLAEGEK